MVTNNPFLGPQWDDLAVVLETSLIQTYIGGMFQVQTYAKQFGLSPSTSPFVQALVFDDTLQVELAANLMVRPQLTNLQLQELEFYGWQLPEINPDDYSDNPSGNPNIVRYFSLDTQASEIVDAILTALVGVYGIVERDFWSFPNRNEADRVGEMRMLGRLKQTSANPHKVIFALPGHHLDMLEQENEDHL